MKKKYFILAIFVFLGLCLDAQQGELLDKQFYYYKGEKNYIAIDFSRISIVYKEKIDVDKIRGVYDFPIFTIRNNERSYIRQHVIPIDEISKMMQNEEVFVAEMEFSEALDQTDYFEIIQRLSKEENVIKVTPTFSPISRNLGISNNFYVNLFKKEDINGLFDLAEKYSIQVLGYNEFMPLWFTLSCSRKTPFGAIEAANLFYETGLFKSAEPELLYHNLSASNDEYFDNQWGLKNIGQHGGIFGVDINVEPAWTITTGSNVVVAVFDHGIKTDHPDLERNIYGTGYDAETNTTPSILRGDHGTPCAGIIGAEQNNIIGISGVAPNAKLMSISINLSWANSPQQLANGFSWAWRNGADIISNSWGYIDELWDYDVPSELLENAIDSALIFGRNGKGTIVVFASGNDCDTNIRYPASHMPDLLVVGAIVPDGQRANFSNYGNELDVVAPGVLIPTTTYTGGYDLYFEGTSAACPHVSGVAALVLSVNPNLTGQQVRNIIESTAQKVRSDLYDYEITPNRPNGTWNDTTGYGLVNAYTAVLAALETICYNGLPIVHGTINQSITWDSPVHATGTVTIHAGATLTITSTVQCENLTNFVVQPGGKLVIDGGTLTAACPGKLWQGIVVLGDSSLPQAAQNQGTVELRNNAVIEHAICAIAAYFNGVDVPIISLTGGIIKASNSTFLNNLKAIAYTPYENKNLNGVIIDNVGKFTNCTFTINNSNCFAANGEVFKNHVTLWGVRGVTFESCTFENNPATPRVGKGIYTADAGFKVINRCPGVGFPGYVDCTCPLQNNDPTIFKNHDIGVHSENLGGAPRPVYIDQSEFVNNTTGVQMEAQPNFRLTRCHFTNVYKYGLVSINSSGYRIEENNFIKPSSFYAVANAGIIMSNSGIAENRIYKNTFENFDKGIYVWENNGRVGRGGGGDPGTGIAPSGLQFICNLFTNNDYDIYVLSNATVRHQQGSLSAGADNQFVNTQTSGFYFAGPQPQAITYYRRPSRPPNPYALFNPTSNITVIDTAAVNPCTSTFCTPGGGTRSDISDLEQYIAIQAQYDQLLTNLGENPEILQQLLVLGDAMRELSDNAISGILHDSILYVDALKSWYEVVRTPIAKYWLAEVYASESNYEQSEVILRAIPPMFDFSEPELIEHDNYMQFHHFKKQMHLSGRNWTLLDESEIAQLQRIAEATKGRSAGMAKGALCFFFDICYEDEFEAEGQGEEEKAEGEKAEGKKAEGEKSPPFGGTEGGLLSIYPNPTPSEMMVSLNNPAVKIVRMEVYDMTSRKVHQQIVNQSSDTLRLNELERGVYILKVYLDQGDMVIRKVVKN